jgi:hypothetical protein
MSMYLENLDLSLVTKQPTRDAELKFPCKLYRMLMETESKGLTHIVSWHKDGKCFRIHDQEAFVEEILPQYFKKSKYRSFQRQCNLYGFSRITAVKPFWDSCYFHPTFNRGDEGCCKKITRPLRGNNKKATTKTTAATNIKENQSEFIYPATPISRAVSSNHTEVSTQVQSENPVPTPVFSNNSSSSANTTNIETSATSDSTTNQRANNDSNLNLSKDEEKQTKSLISMNRRTSYQDLCFSILGDDCGGLCDDNGQQLVQNLIDFQ